mmetsp:Transcript_4413/g.5102  ORF Transcript_4413/g.5102 Transcript_4413/m.5102 type:complete len:178 (-) Transcript_4413:311-844(-)|eukprot:CAMPEP_0194173442 /NCGR_PEP_ID=MMETSP0154-20130528/7786_1 /TAXON_ID=1049557 /ORGANISM="Thalassiothrix antarctica, Strain L6-D1" /LENGTH=177 /DNA_ID=CAMNT_0038886517 /DNA_START=23 /DNA_END=556 /DNA_ORIENTATION=+
MAVYDWISDYKVGIVESIEESGGKGTKALKVCKFNIGDDSNTLQVVTSATNVRKGSRLVVAPIGSTVLGSNGEGMSITKTTVAGHISEGMFCDSKMLGWDGGTGGIAARMEDSLPLGSPPPLNKPRPNGGVVNASSEELPESTVEGLFEKKLTKEEKKALAKIKREAKKAAKHKAKE